jgi:hypothetical protein
LVLRQMSLQPSIYFRSLNRRKRIRMIFRNAKREHLLEQSRSLTLGFEIARYRRQFIIIEPARRIFPGLQTRIECSRTP